MLARSGRLPMYSMYACSAPRAMPRIGVEMLNGKIGQSGRWYRCDELIALPGVGRPSHSIVSRVNASGTKAPATRMSLLAVPLRPAAYHVSTTCQSFFGSRHHTIFVGCGLCPSKIGVPRTTHWQRLLPLENCQSPST